jgi:hypothetical protein
MRLAWAFVAGTLVFACAKVSTQTLPDFFRPDPKFPDSFIDVDLKNDHNT